MSDYIKREDASEVFYMLLERYHDTGVEVIKHTAAIAPKEFHVSEEDDIADFNFEIDGWKKDFSAIPAADVAPVRHGRWLIDSVGVKCSCCGLHDESECIYCPNCGATMDRERKDDE